MPHRRLKYEAATSISQEQRAIDALFRVSHFISAVSDLHQLLDLIMTESRDVMHCESSSLMLYDEESRELYFEVVQGPKSEEIKSIRLKLGQGIAGSCAEEKKTQVVEDVSQDTRHYKKADEKSEYQTRNMMAAPMVRGKKLIGVLVVLNKRNSEKFTKDDVKLLEFFAGEAAIAVENALLIRERVQAERLAAVGVAVAGISHFIKNILAGNQGSTRLIDMGLSASDFNLVKEAWPILKRSNMRITSLVQDMLTYSKSREPEWEEGNVNEMIQEIHESLNDQAQEKGVSLELHLSSEIPAAQYDVKAIHDTVLNIVGNAVEACERTENACIRIFSDLIPNPERIRMRIVDNGPGIPADIQEKIFEPFFSTKGSKGTGLGLAISKKTVEEHNGQMLLESKEGEGTTFQITLPLNSDKKAD